MRVPEPPVPAPVKRISPSLYEALLGCRAKAAWYTQGDRGALVTHPAALLGTSFHVVMEAANKGEFSGSHDERRQAARMKFDRESREAYAGAHPLLRVKFPSPEKLPFYNQQRELVALLSAEVEPSEGNQHRMANGGTSASEGWFESPDRVIVGRPDLLDIENKEIIDYKTGHVSEGLRAVVSDRERRQLNLYGYLANASGYEIARGRIIRADGTPAVIDISVEDANDEAEKARTVLNEYNDSITGASFESLASPNESVCSLCDCLPLCEAFWAASQPAWLDGCGVHVEGTIIEMQEGEIQNTALVTLTLEVTRGTIDTEVAIVEQVPLSWFLADEDRGPQIGDLVRVVNGRVAYRSDPIRLKADRTTTVVWRVTQTLSEELT